MDEYEIIGWPEIQYYMEYEGFKENSALIEPNDNIGTVYFMDVLIETEVWDKYQSLIPFDYYENY